MSQRGCWRSLPPARTTGSAIASEPTQFFGRDRRGRRVSPAVLAAHAATATILARYAEVEAANGLVGLPDHEELDRRLTICRSCDRYHGTGCRLCTASPCGATERWFERLMLGCERF